MRLNNGGVEHAFLLTVAAAPEPATSSLAIAALGLLVVRRQRARRFLVFVSPQAEA
jgi:hypothetical protein